MTTMAMFFRCLRETDPAAILPVHVHLYRHNRVYDVIDLETDLKYEWASSRTDT